jgi:putative membrane protein insertion efficiency factor
MSTLHASLRFARLLPQRTLIALVRGYRLLLKPWLGNACRFEPTCSAYSLQALERHGAIAGTALTAVRVLRCQPWCQGGCDEVPLQAPRLFSRLGLGRGAEPSSNQSPP